MSEYKINKYGNKEWRNSEGNLHREDGPAYESSLGWKEWYINGERHREDGPAIDWNDYPSRRWFYKDKEIKCNSQEEFLKIIKLKAFW